MSIVMHVNTQHAQQGQVHFKFNEAAPRVGPS